MINMSKMLSSIKMDLGVYGMALPFDKPDEVFRDIIELKSLPTFSQFYPYYFPIKVDLCELKELEKDFSSATYELPDVFGNKDILFIRSIDLDYSELSDGYIDPLAISSGTNWGEMMMTQANANLSSIAMPPVTFDFISPNKIKIYSSSTIYSKKVKMDIALEHNANLSTIPKTCYNSFYKLVSLDIKMMLYNNLKHYNDISTAYGNISLKIDDWANAESERNELVKEWEDTFHLDVAQYIII